MRRPTANSALFGVIKTASASAIALTALIACGDYGTSVAPTPSPLIYVDVGVVKYTMPESQKLGLGAEAGASMAVPFGISADIRGTTGAASSVAACGGTGFAGYTEARVPFIPEPSPRFAVRPDSISDDGWVKEAFMPLGFDFKFYGNTYNRVNIYMNGYLLFGAAPTMSLGGTAIGGRIPEKADPRNIIALGWTDWTPQLTPDPIRFETRGTAPNRKFIVQFDNLPEYKGQGRLMGQIVLSEGTNDITLYTNTLTVTNDRSFVTQGIEDLTGTQAMSDSVFNEKLGVWSTRVHNHYSLTNDAIRFSLVSTADDEKPTITAPADITKNNDPGLGTALVSLGTPDASDNCSPPNVTKSRDDGEDINAPYPVGTTTVTWTAMDAFGNASSDVQLVTVIDIENPTIEASDVTVPATTGNGAVVNYTFTTHDNVAVTSVVCDTESGTQFAIGSNPVRCIASDAAALSDTVDFRVNVLDAPTQLANLIAYVQGLGAPNGTANPLLNQLTTAYEHLGDDTHVSCVKLSDFLAMIPKKGRQIPFDATSYMTTEATRIMNVLGCDMKGHALLVPGVGGN